MIINGSLYSISTYTIPRLKCTSSLRAQRSNPEKIIFHFKRGIVLTLKVAVISDCHNDERSSPLQVVDKRSSPLRYWLM